MGEQSFLYSSDLTFDLLSKSSPSQFQQFQPRSRMQQNEKTAANNNKSSNLSHVPCKFYKQGACTAGANCTFSHSSDLSSQAAICKYYLKGNCKFGTKCALLHTMSSFSSNHGSRMVAMTPPNQSSLMDYQPMLSPPTSFGSSAPAVSFIHDPSSLWRHNSDFIGLHSSPRESSSSSMDYLLGTSPFSQQPLTKLSSSLKVFDDVNDVMLPSSLNNDLFTPIELEQRRARQQLTTPDAINIPNTTAENFNSRHSSISSKPSFLPEDDEVQFYMEDDEGYDHKAVLAKFNNRSTSDKYQFPSLLNRP